MADKQETAIELARTVRECERAVSELVAELGEDAQDERLTAALDRLCEADSDLAVKGDKLSFVYTKMLDAVDSWRAMKRLVDAKIAAGEDAVEGIKAHCRMVLERYGHDVIEGPLGRVWIAKNSQDTLEKPEDVAEWPPELLKIVYEPDSAKARAALEAGATIPGFKLVRKDHVRIRKLSK